VICLYSSFLIDFLKNNAAAADKARILEEKSFSISSIGVFEAALDLRAYILSSKISAFLTKEGKAINQSDCLISGTMISNGVNRILTKDKNHFGRIKGIKVISY